MKFKTPIPDLSRFVQAQANVYESALGEIRRGQKRGHWMWFVFPQLACLGRSEMAERYGISGLEEAREYLAHSILGPRLRECMLAVLESGNSVGLIFSYPDDLKFHSCATLFAEASNGGDPFSEVLSKLFGGRVDQETMRLLAG